MDKPTLTTERLILRSFNLNDAPVVTALMQTPDVASTTLTIPFPYDLTMAEGWISTHNADWQEGRGGPWAIIEQVSGNLVGSISLMINPQHQRAEMGYWLGVDYWNKGYMSESGRAIVNFAFTGLKLNRVYAMHFPHNPASGKVMQNMGMRYEGLQRQHVRKGDQFTDCLLYGLTREDWINSRQ